MKEIVIALYVNIKSVFYEIKVIEKYAINNVRNVNVRHNKS